MITLLKNISGNREEWLRVRKSKIGSSEIPTLCGLNPYSSPLKLWREKTGRDAPQPDNDYMWLGRKLEPVIGELFQKKTNLVTQQADTLYGCEEIEFACASPDFFTIENGEKGIVETKNRSYTQKEKYLDGSAPLTDHIQLNWQLGVCGLNFGYIAALVGASPKDFFTPRFEFSKEVFNQSLELAQKFVHYVKTDQEPPAMAMDRDLLESTINRIPNKSKHLPNEAGELLNRYKKSKEEIAELQLKLDPLVINSEECKARLLQMMGDASIGRWGRWICTAKKVEKASYTTKPSAYTLFKLKEENNE